MVPAHWRQRLRSENFQRKWRAFDVTLSPTLTWELDASGDKLTGVQKRGGKTTLELAGVRSPELKRDAPKAWTKPESLFNGKSLDGWEPDWQPGPQPLDRADGLL